MFNNNCYCQILKNKSVNINKLEAVGKIPLTNIRKIVEDNNGFIWLATQDGLYKFDGINIISFNSNEINLKRKLLSNDVSDIYYDSVKNNLYALNAYLGITKICCNTDAIVANTLGSKIENILANSPATKITNINKCFYISTNNGKILKVSDNLKTVELIKLVNNNKVEFLQQLNSNLLIGTEGGYIFYFDVKKETLIQKISISKKENNENHFSNCVLTKNEFIISYSQGIIFIKLNTPNEPLKWESKITNLYVNYVFEKNQIIYYATKKGFFCFNKHKNILEKYETLKDLEDEKWLTNANTIIQNKNNLIIGSTYGLAILKVSNDAFQPFYLCKNNVGLKISHTIGISTIDTNTILIAGFDGAYTYDIKNLTCKEFAKNETFFTAIKIKEEYFVSGLNGSIFFNKDFIKLKESKYIALNDLKPYNISQIDSIPNKYYFFSSEFYKGIFIWDIYERKLTKIPIDKKYGLNNVAINKITCRNNELYIICDNEVAIYNILTKAITHISIVNPKNKKVLNILMDICFTQTEIWLAVYGVGLVKLNNKFEVQQIIETAEGLNNLGVYRLSNIGDSLLIMSSNDGLYSYAPKTKVLQAFFKENGLHNNAFEEGSSCQFGNKLIMGGIKGFTLIDPLLINQNNSPLKLYITSINVKTINIESDTSNLTLKYLKIPSNAIQTRINFIGLNFENPSNIKYWYKINKLESDWISLNNQSFLDLIGFSPGKYEVEIKGCDINNKNSTSIKITLHFLPKWYQTLFFKILVALSIISILALLYNFRIGQLKKIINVRKKISSDLHDDIGSTLSTISMYSQIAQLQPNNPTHATSIQENTKDVLEKLDDIVWATNPKNDQVKNLIERMDSFARPLLHAKGIQFNFTHSLKIATIIINEATRQNLFLIFKEAINNICKYAQCITCTTTIELKSKTLFCSINDDGIGFDTSTATERNGLLNMTERVKQLKGKISIESTKGIGTNILLQLPI